ncbi:orf53b-like protein [Streptococcus pyogenes SSI-1]|nr:orf53b-like protein [Streptococcus pyogenes SSI-1]
MTKNVSVFKAIFASGLSFHIRRSSCSVKAGLSAKATNGFLPSFEIGMTENPFC